MNRGDDEWWWGNVQDKQYTYIVTVSNLISINLKPCGGVPPKVQAVHAFLKLFGVLVDLKVAAPTPFHDLTVPGLFVHPIRHAAVGVRDQLHVFRGLKLGPADLAKGFVRRFAHLGVLDKKARLRLGSVGDVSGLDKMRVCLFGLDVDMEFL